MREEIQEKRFTVADAFCGLETARMDEGGGAAL